MNHYPTASAAATILAAFNLNVSDGPAAKYFAIACAILGAVFMVVGFLRAALTSAKAVQAEAETPRTPSNPPERGTANRRMASAPISPTPSYGTAEISPVSEPSANKPLAGKRISVTGKLPYKREYVEDFIVAMGGTVSRTVTRKTDYLVHNGDYYRRVDESIKHAKACDLHIPIINWESLLELCNLPKDYNIFKSESQDYWRTRHQKRTSVELNRAYGKEYERMAGLLKEILCGNFLGKVSREIKKDLIRPVSVVVKCDDVDQEEIEVLRVCRYEVSPSPNPRYDGDFLFFDERGNECDFKNLTVDSIARLLSVYGR